MNRPRLPSQEELADFRRRVRNAIRFVGRTKTAAEKRELKRFLDSYLGAWQSERIQKLYANQPANEVDRALAAFKIGLKEHLSRVQKKSAAAKRQNHRSCNHWLAETYGQRKSGDPLYSYEKFTNALAGRSIRIPEEHAKQLTRNGEFIGAEAIRLRIIAGRSDSER